MTATVRGVSVGSREGGTSRDGTHEYTVTFLVMTDDVSDGSDVVLNASGIPARGDSYSLGNDFNVSAVVIDKKARERESPTEWEVDVTFSDAPRDRQDNEQQDPLVLPAEVSYGFQARTKVIPGYYQTPDAPNGGRNLELGVVASNGELFDPAPEMEVQDPVMTIKKNLATLNSEWFFSIGNTVNQSEFHEAEPRTLLLRPPQANRVYDPAIGYYWQCTFEFVYRWETWDLQLLNIGTYYLRDYGDFGVVKVPFKDALGNRFVGLLGDTGSPLNYLGTGGEKDWGRYVAGGEDPSFTRVRIYREIDFNNLGII